MRLTRFTLPLLSVTFLTALTGCGGSGGGGTPQATTAPLLSLDKTALSFGPTMLGSSSADQIIQVTNTGNADLHISAFTATNPAFVIGANTCASAIPPAGTCAIAMHYVPTGVGTNTATLSLPSDATGATALVSLSGTAINPAPVLNANTTALSFGYIPISTSSADKTIQISNTGQLALNVGLVSSSDPSFAITGNTCTTPIAPTGVCTLTVRYNRTATSPLTATLSIPSNDPQTPNTTIGLNAATITGIQATSALNYYHYGMFMVTGQGLLGLGLTISDSTGKCTSPSVQTGTTPTDTNVSFQCAVLGSGSITLNVKDATGTVLTTQAFTIPEPKVRIATSKGNIDLQLNPTSAPITVQNFFGYVYGTAASPNFYANTIFHRVISNFMIQGGGFTTGVTGPVQKAPLFNPITLESNNGLKNLRGTIAMARTNVANSATSQFFINHINNTSLDYTSAVTTPNGYAVFGTILAGDTASFATLDAIAAVATQTTANGYANVPVTDVTITSVTQTQ
ncbi:peptidylprolyl isomerase [Leptothrix ochracea]|uniref:peptidylprolyl isomerase n=1 Tax=Leptothrix ochracea TaxID=735331 RepID=UPI0034E1AD20